MIKNSDKNIKLLNKKLYFHNDPDTHWFALALI